MSNIMAAIGLEQLRRFTDFADVRRRRAQLYDRLLRDHPRIRPVARDHESVVPHIYVVRILGLQDRDALQAGLLAQGVQTGSHYQPNHWLYFYHDPSAAPLPVTESVYPEILTLPLHCDLSESDVRRVCTVLDRELSRA